MLRVRWNQTTAVCRFTFVEIWCVMAERKLHTSRVIEYIAEEVHRQGHNLHLPDGFGRVGAMLKSWTHAVNHYPENDPVGLPSLAYIEYWGKTLEPLANEHGFRTCRVFVGGMEGASPIEVVPRLEQLWRDGTNLAPMEFYRAFEEIHPFADGNGRTGKILLNWLNETLLDPIFPPSDLWGYPIQNP